MTVSEFDTKAILHEEDAVAVLKDCSFIDIRDYVARGPDIRVAELLKGIFVARDVLTRDQLFEVICFALFPHGAWMRFGTAVLAIRLARTVGCESELRNYIQHRWASIDQKACHEFILGLSGDVDVASWLPFLRALFDINENDDVRAQLVKVIYNAYHAKKIAFARILQDELLRKMSFDSKSYSDIRNFQFIKTVGNQ